MRILILKALAASLWLYGTYLLAAQVKWMAFMQGSKDAEYFSTKSDWSQSSIRNLPPVIRDNMNWLMIVLVFCAAIGIYYFCNKMDIRSLSESAEPPAPR